jgi:hypothetical protein
MHRIAVLSLIVLFGGTMIPVQANETARFDCFDCLPEGIKLDDVVSYGTNKRLNVTVLAKLTEMKAHCADGKLLDENDKEIRFFRVSCWGYRPPDYLEIRRREKAKLEELKEHYTVIVFGCNPRIK